VAQSFAYARPEFNVGRRGVGAIFFVTDLPEPRETQSMSTRAIIAASKRMSEVPAKDAMPSSFFARRFGVRPRPKLTGVYCHDAGGPADLGLRAPPIAADTDKMGADFVYCLSPSALVVFVVGEDGIGIEEVVRIPWGVTPD